MLARRERALFDFAHLCFRHVYKQEDELYAYFRQSSSQNCLYLDFEENSFRARILGRFNLFQSSASRSQFWLLELPEPLHDLISKKNHLRAMKLRCFRSLQSSASRSPFWLLKLASQQLPDFHVWSIFSPTADLFLGFFMFRFGWVSMDCGLSVRNSSKPSTHDILSKTS